MGPFLSVASSEILPLLSQYARRILLSLSVLKNASRADGSELAVVWLLDAVSALCAERIELPVLEIALNALANLCDASPAVARAALSRDAFSVLGACGDLSAALPASSAEALARAIATLCRALLAPPQQPPPSDAPAAPQPDVAGQRLARSALLHLLDMFSANAPTVQSCARALVRSPADATPSSPRFIPSRSSPRNHSPSHPCFPLRAGRPLRVQRRALRGL